MIDTRGYKVLDSEGYLVRAFVCIGQNNHRIAEIFKLMNNRPDWKIVPLVND